jgi:hypothetical protein
VQPVAVVENSGIIRKSGGTGTTAFWQDYGGWRFINTGTLEVQRGTFDVGPNYQPSVSSRTVLRLSGFESGTSYGKLSFAGQANLAGTLVVELGDNFVPATNGTFTLATYPSRSGEFISPVLPALGSGRGWEVEYQPNALELSVAGVVVGQNGGSSFEAGTFQLTLSGPAGQYALLQGTTNLVNWVTIQTNRPFNGEFQFSDPAATNGSKFYRTVIVP